MRKEPVIIKRKSNTVTKKIPREKPKNFRRLCRLRIITHGSTILAFVRTTPKSLASVAYDEEKEGTH